MSIRPLVLSAAIALPLALTACGGSDKNASTTTGSNTSRSIAVKITDGGCEPARIETPAGPTTFQVQNDGADAVTEFEILDGDRILGEAENVAPGLTRSFSLTLKPGTYTTYCPGGTSTEKATLVVTGSATGQASTAARTAVASYRTYLETQTRALVAATGRFVAAVGSGNVERAKKLYGPARVPYERIEPVAESFGTLDPAIDARAGDVPEDNWTGFHPLEQALWARGSLDNTSALADKLLRDVKTLQAKVRTVELEPAQIANGAVELLGEVSKSKVTGEEERYSHIDLVDFEANVDGAHAAFRAVRPIVARHNANLAKTIESRFAAVGNALGGYRAPGGFVSYTTLTPADTRKLSRSIDALAEPLSRVGAIVVAKA